jgi:hypothetical protein
MQDAHGHIRFGRYQGRIARLDWPRPEGRWQRMLQHLRHKRWQYLALTHPDYVIAWRWWMSAGPVPPLPICLIATGRLLADVGPTAFHAMPPSGRPALCRCRFSSRALAIRFSACGAIWR